MSGMRKHGDPEQVLAAHATTDLLGVLGVRPVVGRLFNDSDGAVDARATSGRTRIASAIVISHEFWTRRFGMDRGIVGQTVVFGDGMAEIVGVAEPRTRLWFPPRANLGQQPDVWVALRPDFVNADRNSVTLRVVARLNDGVTVPDAQRLVDSVAADLRQRFPLKDAAGLFFKVVSMKDDVVGEGRTLLLSLLASAVCLVGLVCINLSALFSSHIRARAPTLAIRSALGASDAKLRRHVLAEIAVVIGLGTSAAIVSAFAGVMLVRRYGPPTLPRIGALEFDAADAAFGMVLGLVCVLLCAAIPLRHVERLRAEGLHCAGRGRIGPVTGPVAVFTTVFQVALSFVLVLSAAALYRDVSKLQRADLGFQYGDVLTFFLPARAPSPEARAQFKRELRQALQDIDGVVAVSAGRPLPLDGLLFAGRWRKEDADDPNAFSQASFYAVLPGFFDALSTTVVEGRTFNDADNSLDRNGDERRIVIDSILAERAFQGSRTIGRRLLVRANRPDAELFEVIGVVRAQRHSSIRFDGQGAIYFTDGYMGTGSDSASRWAVRVAGDPAAFVPAIGATIRRIDPFVAPTEIQLLSDYVDRAIGPTRFTAFLIGLLAVVGAVVAAGGMYGLAASRVGARRVEIGVRLALGAQPRQVVFALVSANLLWSIAGVVVGCVLALTLARLLLAGAIGSSMPDFAMYVVASAATLSWAIGVAWLPARRALQQDPARTLNSSV